MGEELQGVRQDMGASAEPTGLSSTTEPQEGLGPSGFDPSRDFVNEFFRGFYPPDWETEWTMQHISSFGGRRYTGAHKETHDNVFPPLVCADGLKLSMQGHFGAYSYPRDDFADEYQQVEIMGPPGVPELAAYERECNSVGERMIYPYVPVAIVNALIAGRGGLASDSDGSPEGQDAEGGLIGEADDSAVPERQSPNPPKDHP